MAVSKSVIPLTGGPASGGEGDAARRVRALLREPGGVRELLLHSAFARDGDPNSLPSAEV